MIASTEEASPLLVELASSGTPGRDHLERRSRLNKRIAEVVRIHHIQIIDDNRFDADVLASCIRQVLGREIPIEISKSTQGIREQFAKSQPDLVFLDDRLGPAATATSNIPHLRRGGYHGPIVAVSGLLTRQRRIELLRLGATSVLHKDDFDSLQIAELLLALFDTPPSGSPRGMS